MFAHPIGFYGIYLTYLLCYIMMMRSVQHIYRYEYQTTEKKCISKQNHRIPTKTPVSLASLRNTTRSSRRDRFPLYPFRDTVLQFFELKKNQAPFCSVKGSLDLGAEDLIPSVGDPRQAPMQAILDPSVRFDTEPSYVALVSKIWQSCYIQNLHSGPLHCTLHN